MSNTVKTMWLPTNEGPVTIFRTACGFIALCIIAAVAAVPVAPGAAWAAEVTIFSDSPLQLALTNIAQDFQRASGHTVRFVFGLSPVIHKKVVNGEATDVVIIQPNFKMSW